MPKIIAFSGYKGSGKDTAASNFKRLLPHVTHNIQIFSFAFNLKKELSEILGQSLEWLEANKNNPVIRHMLQWYGTEFAKGERGSDVWIKALEKEIAALKEPAIILIPDLRFVEEAKWVKAQEGIIFKVTKKGHINEDIHISETELDKIKQDFLLYNNGSNLREFELECRWACQFARERLKV
jgi:energy-coupling factor transporter ATP-binding protein EcfA2